MGKQHGGSPAHNPRDEAAERDIATLQQDVGQAEQELELANRDAAVPPEWWKGKLFRHIHNQAMNACDPRCGACALEALEGMPETDDEDVWDFDPMAALTGEGCCNEPS